MDQRPLTVEGETPYPTSPTGAPMIEVYDLRRLPEDGETIEEPLAATWLDAVLNEGGEGLFKASGDGHAKLELAKVGDHEGAPVVRVHGAVHATVQTPCVRCLSDLTLSLDCAPDFTLFPAEKAARGEDEEAEGDEEEVPVEPAQLDEGTYEHHEIDLPGLVREVLLLEVMMSPACPEEEACAARTAALIASVTPSESPDSVDPRWAALAELKSKIPH